MHTIVLGPPSERYEVHMTALTSIIPGKVVNNGINDVSTPEYTPAQTTRPLHLPVIHGVFPKGQMADVNGVVWVNTSQVGAVFGQEIFDPVSPYYNPNTLLLQALAAGGQAVVGIRRLSANNQVARTALSAFVSRKVIPDYERDINGRYKRDETGNLIPKGSKTYNGLLIEIKVDPDAATKGVGELTRRTIPEVPAAGGNPAVPAQEVFPLFDGIGGIGDTYNRGGMNFGVRPDAFAYGDVASFVKETGVYPFNLRQFIDTAAGKRQNAKTVKGREMVEATLFDCIYQKTRYSIKRAFGEFTGTDVNRKVVPAPAPYSDVYVYQDSIKALCQAMYAIESPENTGLVEVTNQPYRQMNPFTCVDHNGVPYYAITTVDTVSWDMTAAVKITGGVSPFLDKDGNLPSYITPAELDDPFGVLANTKSPISRIDAWAVNNHLIASDLEVYVDSIEQSNYTRNRQSFFYDIGYTQDVKDQAIRLLGSRKDIMVIPCATVWAPGKFTATGQLYARAGQLNSAVRMFPESEFWGTPTTRSSINLIEAYVVDEVTAEYFSGNIDLAFAYAEFAGNAQGIIIPSKSPSHGDNRILRTMHSPRIEFEGDGQAAENFNRGCITLRPYDAGDRLFRPALVTVNPNVDSVLKDQVTAFLCVCIEKICQDMWNLVCGDTNLTAANYVAVFKDKAERKCRDSLGSLARNITVEPSYAEGTVGSRAVMNARVHAYFNKGKYQMNMDLFAHNEEELANA